jgi:hypothetical protein
VAISISARWKTIFQCIICLKQRVTLYFVSCHSIHCLRVLNPTTASSRSIWPPVDCCFNPACTYVKEQKLLKVQGAEDRNVVLYTSEGPMPAKYIHISCDSEYLLFSFYDANHNFKAAESSITMTITSRMMFATIITLNTYQQTTGYRSYLR